MNIENMHFRLCSKHRYWTVLQSPVWLLSQSIGQSMTMIMTKGRWLVSQWPWSWLRVDGCECWHKLSPAMTVSSLVYAFKGWAFIHSLTSSVQRILGLLLLHFPAMYPFGMWLQTLSDLAVWPKYYSLLWLSGTNLCSGFIISSIEVLVLCCVKLIFIILHCVVISNAFNLLMFNALSVQLSTAVVCNWPCHWHY